MLFRSVEGELSLPLLPPFQLEISPEPLEGAVRWRGRPLSAQTDRPGRFVVPTAKQPSTSAQGNKDGAPRRNGGEASEDQALPRP